MDLGKEINRLDKYLNNIISGSEFQRLFILHESNIICKRKEYIRYSKKYLKKYRIYMFKIYKLNIVKHKLEKKYILIKLF